jgi:hypothetical protein
MATSVVRTAALLQSYRQDVVCYKQGNRKGERAEALPARLRSRARRVR